MLAVFGVAGCGNTATNAARLANEATEADGSPFIWKTQSVGNGGTALFLTLAPLPVGPTRADPNLQSDVTALIAKAEAAEGRPLPVIEKVHHMRDGREVWVILTGNLDGLAYIVEFRPSPQGGTEIALSKAREYSKSSKAAKAW